MKIACWKVEKSGEETAYALTTTTREELSRDLDHRWNSSEKRVRIRVHYSSLNYKDGLAMNGHPGVASELPLIPGIDAAGEVLDTGTDKFSVGDEVLVFHANFGTACHGAYAEEIVVPESWVYHCPAPLSLRDAMTLGTAGFTAAQCVQELQRHAIETDDGEIVVSGATGGVGVFAVKILAKLGYRVVASTGKTERTDWLMQQGANEVIDRETLNDTSGRPLLKSRWAGAVDTVGGNTLSSIIRATRGFGCVTACGLVGGSQLETTVYPYILRGVTLQGVDTANISYQRRSQIWEKLATEWKLDNLSDLATEISLAELPDAVGKIMSGQVTGRTLVRVYE